MEPTMPTIRRGDVDLYYTDVGAGPVVLLHTGGCGDGRMWDLAGYPTELAGYRILNLDHRGHGRSGKPAAHSAHRLTEYVEDVIAVLDAARADRASVIGYSAGASVAYATAAAWPGRIGAVIGIGAVGPPQVDADDDSALIGRVREIGTAAVMQEFSDGEPEPAPDWLLENLSTTDAEMFALLLEAWSTAPTNWDLLANVQAPTLLVGGELEEERAETHLLQAARMLLHGEAAVVPGIGHLQVFWRTDLSLPLITGFLRRVWPSPGV
jgi:pimeloyl-ACP methyl ester carboxylesterase